MRKVDKFIAKLEREPALRTLATIRQIRAGDFAGLNLKKLGGTSDRYRIRIGRIRIKFIMSAHKIAIYDIGFRDDNTYSK